MEREIAKLPTRHSWVAKLMMADDPDEAENKKDQIVVQKAEKMGLPYEVQRLVRTALPLYLEREAISQYVANHPDLYQALPVVHDPQEAVEVAALDQMGVTSKEKQQAVKLLKALQTHTLPQAQL